MSDSKSRELIALERLEAGTSALRVLLEGGLPRGDGAIRQALVNLEADYRALQSTMAAEGAER